nr:PREDICTED: uncharacterized protein LOC107776176 [Nicotiana tabacum]
MRDPMHHHSLFEQERGLKLQLEKWVLVEESMLKQKSRVQWLKLGDANNAYFFASMKNRIVHNQIRRLETAEGHTIINHKDIEAEVTHFCHRLLGLSTTKIYVVQQDVMEEGCKLTRAQQLQLIGLVSKEEISNALKEINDQKAPRYDGFNSLFFKKSWCIVGEEITCAIQNFFDTTTIFKPINYTSVTLIPKVKNPRQVKEFRPISCCTV